MPGLFRRWRARPVRVRLATGLLVTVGVLWPMTHVALALGVPLFEHTMLALSWAAPAVSALDVLFTAQVAEKQDGDGRG